jgi:hypothetical protein
MTSNPNSVEMNDCIVVPVDNAGMDWLTVVSPDARASTDNCLYEPNSVIDSLKK